MFKLNKRQSDRFRDKFDFKFSNFQAIEVPKGWDKLFVSLVSVETGKTIAKSGKASVRNGTCRWIETFSESIFISQENGNSKELECNRFKFVVAMGSSRSGILGEVTLNLGDHMSTKAPNSLTVLLNKCNYTTSLQFKIQCLTPKPKYRDSQNKETNVDIEDGSSDPDEIETKSEESDSAFSRSVGSTSSNHLESTSVSRATFSREPSEPRHSFESTGASTGNDHIERRDSTGSHNSSRLNNSSFQYRELDSPGPNGHPKDPNSSTMSSPDLLEAAEVTIEELRAEARMWERNAKKLMVDVDSLKKELSDQSRNQETLTMELLASHQECNDLKEELEHLKTLLEESTKKKNVEEDSKLQDMDGAQQEMEEEIRFLKESNADLSEQLQKTQESNIELLTILQELEAIVETQKSEIQNLTNEKLKLEEGAKLAADNSDPEGIDNIKLQLLQLQETQEELESAIRELESTILQKDQAIEMERELRMDSESKWKGKLAEKEEEIVKLEGKLSEAAKSQLAESKFQSLDPEKTTQLEVELQKARARVDQQQNEIRALRQQLKQYQEKEMGPTKGPGGREKLPHANGPNFQSVGKRDAEGITTSTHLKGEVIDALKKQLSALESQVSNLHEEKRLLQESLEVEKTRSSECLTEEKKKIVGLERLVSEMERGKEEVEQQMSLLEKENMQLTERISALEAQLRHLTNEKEAYNLELHDAKSQIIKLRDEMKKMETDIEARKVEMKRKMMEVQTRWLEAQEECEYLKQANPKLQTTAENLIEECTSLQKYNGELKRQNMELVTRYSAMESQLRDSIARFSECSQKVEALEAEFSVMAEEFSLKEKSLKSELESIVNADKEYKEKLMQENANLNNMYSQKVVEVEKVQRELVHLIDQISLVNTSQSSETMLELSNLRTEKAKLEVSLQQLQRQFVRSESKLSDSEAKVQDLTRELKASRQKQEALMADHDKVLKLVDGFKSNEAKHKATIAGLEKNLKASGYETRQLTEEVSSLKEQLQRLTSLQSEVLTLKSSLNSARFEYDKAKASLDLIQSEHEKLKAERNSLAQKVSSMEKAVLEYDEVQRSKMTLEEKVVRLEGDLAAREKLCLQDAELKFELNKVKRANGELQRRVKHLEQDIEEYVKKVKTLDERLKRKGHGTHDDDEESGSNPSDVDDESDDEEDHEAAKAEYLSKIQALENELAEALEASEMYKSQLRRVLEEQKNAPKSDVAALEAELRDLREKYFQMSLKYAEVEAQREELVLKLKSTNTTKRRWF